MENVSVGGLGGGGGPSNRYTRRQRRELQPRMNLIEESSEEEQDTHDHELEDCAEECQEDEAGAGNGVQGKMTYKVGNCLNGPVYWTVTDPEVLDCPVCYEHLTIPVFQCENGHIACSTCCASPRLKHKCPSCGSRIGYKRCRAVEKVLKSVKVIFQSTRNSAKKQR